MTKLEYQKIIEVFDMLENEECQYCDKYCAVDPEHAQGRIHRKEVFLSALYMARREIKERAKIDD